MVASDVEEKHVEVTFLFYRDLDGSWKPVKHVFPQQTSTCSKVETKILTSQKIRFLVKDIFSKSKEV